VNGQIQYGPARPLTLHPTLVARSPRAIDPARFSGRNEATRLIALVLGASLLLAVLLTTTPRQFFDVALAVVLGGAWLSLVLAMTVPRPTERAGQELVRRLAQFRHELNAIGDNPSRATLERMIARAGELDLEEQEVADELAQLRACLEALALKDALARGEMPVTDAADPLPPGDRCHFVTPVRFGRRRSDQFGHLVLTTGWLKFRGTLDISHAWSELASISRDGRDIVVALQDSRRVLRFSCHSLTEAARGGVLAEHLAHAARVEATSTSAAYHAAV
jgi:hypothetical protein